MEEQIRADLGVVDRQAILERMARVVDKVNQTLGIVDDDLRQVQIARGIGKAGLVTYGNVGVGGTKYLVVADSYEDGALQVEVRDWRSTIELGTRIYEQLAEIYRSQLPGDT